MANTRQQKKRIKTNEKRRLQNSSFKSSLRTAIKNFKKFITSEEKEKAFSFLNLINKKLDKSLTKGIYHTNFVSRMKSNLSKLLNKLSNKI